jgi:alpha-beta hydrolase superfamily lysophospholipase
MKPTAIRLIFLIAIALMGTMLLPYAHAESDIKVGVVVMHGKGGSPKNLVSGLAAALENHGFLVANLEMPWSGRRDYDTDVSGADKEVEIALNELRSKGARMLFLVGHSLGGAFAFSFGSRHILDGIVVIAPGGDVSGKQNIDRFSESVATARKLIDEGKGDEKTRLMDYEGSRGAYPVVTTPRSYLSWFDPDGAMNQPAAISKINPSTPVLYIAPKDDYPNLRRIKQERFDALPSNPLTKLIEPNSNHKDAPSVSSDAVIEWISTVISVQ